MLEELVGLVRTRNAGAAGNKGGFHLDYRIRGHPRGWWSLAPNLTILPCLACLGCVVCGRVIQDLRTLISIHRHYIFFLGVGLDESRKLLDRIEQADLSVLIYCAEGSTEEIQIAQCIASFRVLTRTMGAQDGRRLRRVASREMQPQRCRPVGECQNIVAGFGLILGRIQGAFAVYGGGGPGRGGGGRGAGGRGRGGGGRG